MKTIERSEFRSEDGTISLEQRLRGTLKFGLRWYGEMRAQVFVTEKLGKSLGPDYVLIRNLSVPGTFHILPLVLIGPVGVRALFASPARGVYRAKGEDWLAFNAGARHFRRTRPNLQAEILGHAKIVKDLLQARGYSLPEVEAVLVFANPRTHVDTARPNVRIVLADGIDHFAANLEQFPSIMNKGDVDLLVDALTQAPAEPEPEPEPVPVVAPIARAAPPRPAPAVGMPVPPNRRRGMSRVQWLVLGGLLLGLLGVTAVFVFVVLNPWVF